MNASLDSETFSGFKLIEAFIEVSVKERFPFCDAHSVSPWLDTDSSRRLSGWIPRGVISQSATLRLEIV